MPTFSCSADVLKYASGSSWTSGKARQGVYSGTRYEGAISFAGLSELPTADIRITQIQLRVTFGTAGADSAKYLTLYKATSNTISGSTSAMRGDAIAALSVTNAYDRTETLTFSASYDAAVFNTLKDYFMGGSRVLILYVPTTRGTHSGGYCYDYLAVTAATLTVSYDYLKSTGALAASGVAAGSAARLNITASGNTYSHRVTWRFGTYAYTQSVPAGTASASYTIPLNWLNAIPSATSGPAQVTLETLDASGNSLGSNAYGFTISAPSGVVPTISSVSVSAVNSSSVLNGWGLFVCGKSRATVTVSGAAGAYGSTIKSYSIETDPDVGNATASTLTTGTLNRSGTINVTARVVDSRGRTGTKSASFYVYPYSAPSFSSVTAYRCNSGGTRDDSGGTYAYVKAAFSCSSVNGRNSVTGNMTLSQVGGSYSTSKAITSGSGNIVGGGNLVADAVYRVTLTLTDSVGSTTSHVVDIPSAAYVMHVKKGGRAIGFGRASGEDSTVSFGWPVKLSTPLEVSQGGTGATSRDGACDSLGAVKRSGDTMTGNLSVQIPQYSAVHLKPFYNGSTSRAVFEGSYQGGASIASWDDSSGNNRRMLEVRNKTYQSSLDSAVLLRVADQGSWANYRVFHAGMPTPVPVANGGTGAANAKAALTSLGIFYAASLPSSGTDGQICLVPV